VVSAGYLSVNEPDGLGSGWQCAAFSTQSGAAVGCTAIAICAFVE
jgi:hypothetical protein